MVYSSEIDMLNNKSLLNFRKDRQVVQQRALRPKQPAPLPRFHPPLAVTVKMVHQKGLPKLSISDEPLHKYEDFVDAKKKDCLLNMYTKTSFRFF